MKTEFRKSFVKDLQRQAKDKNLMTHTQKIILEVEAAGGALKISNLKKLKAKDHIFGSGQEPTVSA